MAHSRQSVTRSPHTLSLQSVARNPQFPICGPQPAICGPQPAYPQPAICGPQPAARNLWPAARNPQPATRTLVSLVVIKNTTHTHKGGNSSCFKYTSKFKYYWINRIEHTPVHNLHPHDWTMCLISQKFWEKIFIAGSWSMRIICSWALFIIQTPTGWQLPHSVTSFHDYNLFPPPFLIWIPWTQYPLDVSRTL